MSIKRFNVDEWIYNSKTAINFNSNLEFHKAAVDVWDDVDYKMM